MPVFEFSFVAPVSLKVITTFHQRTHALRKLTPPPVLLQFNYVEPLAEGSRVKFTMWFGPIPLRWEAVHQDVNDNGFTDIQKEGPFRFWKHRHRFEMLDLGNTRVSDRIEYEYRAGLSGLLTRLLFNSISLSIMFQYRKQVICNLKD